MSNKESVCVFETARLVGILFTNPKPANGKSGYAVLKLVRNDKTYTALQPYEKWKDPDKIKLLIDSDIRITHNVYGQIRVHENMQKEIFDEINSIKKDLKDSDEILAMGIEANNRILKDLKNFILEILNRVDAVEKSIIVTDNDLDKLRKVLIFPENYPKAIPSD